MVLGIQLVSTHADATAGLNPIGIIIRCVYGDDVLSHKSYPP